MTGSSGRSILQKVLINDHNRFSYSALFLSLDKDNDYSRIRPHFLSFIVLWVNRKLNGQS